jgi:hypothetical protein
VEEMKNKGERQFQEMVEAGREKGEAELIRRVQEGRDFAEQNFTATAEVRYFSIQILCSNFRARAATSIFQMFAGTNFSII